MRTYAEQNFPAMSEILMQVAQGIAAVSGYKYVISDMVHTLHDLSTKLYELEQPYYIGIREQGVEGGTKEYCLDRCKGLGYPLVIAKIDKGTPFDWDLTLMFTHNWMNGDNNYMEQEFNSL
jgi:hypothetical protein